MHASLHRLTAGSLDWLVAHLDHFDPFSPSGRSAGHGKAKAALELALLCHCWARLTDVHDERLARATGLLHRLWQHPHFPRHLHARPEYASSYGLIFAALAPDGIDDAVCRAVLTQLTPGFLSPLGKSPYQRLEIRYYADKAGVRHTMEPYTELVGQSRLVRLPAAPPDAAPLTTGQAYALTHTSFYLGDFGRTDPGLSGTSLARAQDVVSRMLLHCVRHERWDLAAELVLTQFILGAEPLRTPSGAAALECLVHAQRPDGALPGRSAALRAAASAPPGEFFRKAYHTTLVTALMALVLSSARRS
jgi:hypothetical protein